MNTLLTHPPPLPAGLLGDGFPHLLDLARRRVVQPGATVVPAAATVYCVGIEALTGQVAGFDLSPMNAYRWGARGRAAWQRGRRPAASCAGVMGLWGGAARRAAGLPPLRLWLGH